MPGNQVIFQQAMNQGHSAAWDQLWDRAERFYRQAIEEFPEHPQALANLGLALIELQEYEESLQCYQQVTQVTPEDPIPWEKIAQLYERLGNLDKAIQASLRSAEAYLNNRDVDKAIENWVRATRLVPEDLRAHSRLALVYERIGKKDEAVQEFLAVASILQTNGELEKAVKTATRAFKVMPTSKEAAHALLLLKDFQPLPKPKRPRGATAPIRMSQVRQLEAPKDIDQIEVGQDPVVLAQQKALTILAGMLFEDLDDDPDAQAKRDLQTIVEGTGGLKRAVDQTQVALNISQVVNLQTQGDYSQAAEELEQAIDIGLNHPAAYFDLGYLYAQSERIEGALRQLQHAVNHPDLALGAHLLIGELLKQKGQIKEASTEFLEALKLADSQMVPSNQANDLRQLYGSLIEAHRLQADQDTQTQLCENIHDLLMRSDWRAQLMRAREQLPSREGEGPPVPLAELLTEARTSQVIDTLTIISDLADQGKPRAAMEEAFFALQQTPTYLPLHTYMGELLVKQGNIQGAVAKFLVIAKTYGMRGETAQAVSLYRKITEIAPMDLNARGQLFDHLLSSGQTEEAIAEYMQLADVYYSLADLNMARKTYKDALRITQKPNLDRSWQVKILHRMADIDTQSLDWRQAVLIYQQIRTLQPDDEKARSSLIELNFRLGQEQQALSELDNFMGYLSDNNQQEKALAFLESLVEESANRVPVRRRLADLHKLLGRTEEAVAQLDAIGELLLEAGDRAGAIRTIEMILDLDPPKKAEYQRLLAHLGQQGV